MSDTTKTRKPRAPRTKKAVTAPEAVKEVPPVHQRWTQLYNRAAKTGMVALSSPARVEAWEWFVASTADPKVVMTDKSTGVFVAGLLLSRRGGLLLAVSKARKGGRP